MKARTKLQKEVTQLSGYLCSIGNDIKEWAYKECLEHKGYANKSITICLDCGNTFSLDFIARKRATCPHCDTKIKIEYTRRTTLKQQTYYAVTEIVNEFQVVRNFVLYSNHKKGRPVDYTTYEIMQYWIAPNSKVTMIGLNHTLNWHCDCWGGGFEIRVAPRSYYSRDKFDIYPYKYHPSSTFKPEFKLYGINYRLQGINVLDAIKLLPDNPKAETLLKAKQYSLLGRCSSYENDINRYWNSIKICLRNKYIVKDASMYIDYLDLLRYFNKDLRNAKYVCPKDFKKEHDRLMHKKFKIERAERAAIERLRDIKKRNNLKIARKEYVERFKKFFDLEFSKENISIKVLSSINEFKTEAEELNHCLFVNEYYLKENSLILSAKVEGKRTETIEVSLNNFEVEQSRGYNNIATGYHAKIVALVEQNMNKIIAVHKGRTNNNIQILKQVS